MTAQTTKHRTHSSRENRVLEPEDRLRQKASGIGERGEYRREDITPHTVCTSV